MNFQTVCIALGTLIGGFAGSNFSDFPWLSGALVVLAAAVIVLISVNGQHSDRSLILRWMARRDNAWAYRKLVWLLDRAISQALVPMSHNDGPGSIRHRHQIDWDFVAHARDTAERKRLARSAFSRSVFVLSLKISMLYPAIAILSQWLISNRISLFENFDSLPEYPTAHRAAIALPPLLFISLCILHSIFKKPLFSLLSALTILFSPLILYYEDHYYAYISTYLIAFLWATIFVQESRAAYLIFILAGAGFLSFSLAFGTDRFTEEVKMLLLFLGLLPIPNAVFDYLSYGITLTLLRAGWRSRKTAATLACGILDIFAALASLFGLSLFLALIIAAINAASAAPLLPLEKLYTDLSSPETRGGYTWLYLCLLSTLVPTGVHLVIVLLSAMTWAPRSWKLKMVALIERPESDLSTLAGVFGFALLLTVYGMLWALVLLKLAPWIFAEFERGAMLLLDSVFFVLRLLGAA